MLQGRYYKYTRSGAQKIRSYSRKVQGHDKTLIPEMKPEVAAKMKPNLPCNTEITNSSVSRVPSIEKGLRGRGFRRKVHHNHKIVRPKVFPSHLQFKDQLLILLIKITF